MRSKDTTNLVLATLRDEILNLDIQPGQLFKEGELCERFEASRTPVHAALERLSEEKLMEFVPYKGVRATLLNFSNIYQSILLRALLETEAIVEFTKQADAFSLERCAHLMRNQQILLSSEQFEPSAFYGLDARMHKVWFDEAGLPLFWDVIQNAEVNYTRFRMLDIVKMHNFKEIVHEHVVLLSLMEQRRIEKIERVVNYHLFGGIRRMHDLLRTELAPYFEDVQSIKPYLDRVMAIQRPPCLSEE